MTCCGPLVETTDQDDKERIYLCSRCGKQGPARGFPDPPQEPERPESYIDRARLRLAETLDRLADFVAPK